MSAGSEPELQEPQGHHARLAPTLRIRRPLSAQLPRIGPRGSTITTKSRWSVTNLLNGYIYLTTKLHVTSLAT